MSRCNQGWARVVVRARNGRVWAWVENMGRWAYSVPETWEAAGPSRRWATGTATVGAYALWRDVLLVMTSDSRLAMNLAPAMAAEFGPELAARGVVRLSAEALDYWIDSTLEHDAGYAGGYDD